MPFLSYRHALQLKEQLEGTAAEVVTSESEDYAKSIQRWSDTCEKEAGAIVRVTSTSEVSIVVEFAQKHHVKYVVEAGGHSTTGASASHGGIVISMTTMRKVMTDTASRTVCVQGGAIWKDVNRSTMPHGLAVVGATADQTGVAASTLGGGYGWLSGLYGLIMDSLLSVKMVLADGSVVEASDESHPDLFWAVRGAGLAFGVVTELVFRAHPIPPRLFGGSIYYTGDKLPQIVRFANQFHERQDPKSGLFFGFRAHPLVRGTAIVVLLFYHGTQSEGEAFFRDLLTINAAEEGTGPMSYAELHTLANIEPIPEGRKSIDGTTVTFPLAMEKYLAVYDKLEHISRTYPEIRESTLVFEMLPYGKVKEVPLDATACASRGPYYNVGLVFCWRNPELDRKIVALKRDVLDVLKRESSEEEAHAEIYPNLAGHEFRASQLFRGNLDRLRELKKKYDPENVFRHWHNLLN
ncbi:hypothetical protein HFD88_009157 [Aspergillus terreus]|nr:hypothetical protein HFD88_009157 [Aspergillus terreus]